MTELSFTTPKRATNPITFHLDGVPYTFNPPKAAEMVMPIIDGNGTDQEMMKATFDWLGNGLSTEEHQRLIARIKDPADDLDVATLADIVKGLAEQVAGNRPTM